MIFRKRLSHIRHFLPLFICLTCITIMINSYPLHGFRPVLFSDDNYNFDLNEWIVSDDANKFLLVKYMD